uniref:NADH-plastoquinone oxidoreductase subunit J n=1 Tax=Santalum album TaxID=35974 RepID=A0A6M8B1C4_SANAL|nr:NADH-plastoquinone oxidoreductase subunit J [Santalum album]
MIDLWFRLLRTRNFLTDKVSRLAMSEVFTFFLNERRHSMNK